MRRLILVILLVCFILLAAAAVSVRPIVKFIAKKQLENIFPQSEVSIAGCTFLPVTKLILTGIRIKREKIYDFDIKEAGAVYNFSSLLKRNILEAYLKDAKINISLGGKSIVEFSKYLFLKSPSVFLVSELGLSNLILDLKSKEATVNAGLSLGLNMIKQELKFLDIKIDSFDGQGVHLEGASLRVAQGSPEGDFFIRQVKYDKAKVEDIKSKVVLKAKNLSFNNLSAKLFDGSIQAEAKFTLDQNPAYAADMKFTNVDIARFVRDFKLEEKLEMTGKLSGELRIRGRGALVRVIDGDFSAGAGGGIMVIKDEAMLKNMAQASNQPMDIFVESFKDYHYNTGIMKLNKKRDNLLLDIELEGEKGKRNLGVTLHNFRIK